ncbi:MAG: hypothetical protein J6M95_03925 [Bacilli bacterium]|nr:hypothetical protein [Bacilli bacterium]
MRANELYKMSWNNYKRSGCISNILHFFLGLLAASFVLFGLFLSDLFIIVVPLLVIPTIFACQLATILLREQEMISFKGFVRCFGSYFSSKFNSTYRVIRSALWAFLIYIIFAVIYGVIVNLILYSNNFMGYQEIVKDVVDHLNVTPEEMTALLGKYDYFFKELLIYNYVPSLFVFSLSFIIVSTRFSVSLFERLENYEQSGRLDKIIQQNVMSKYFKEYNLTFIKLNWPLFLIYIISFGIGAYLGYLFFGSYTGIFTLGLSISIFVSYGIYGPFLLSNNEAIYESFKDKYISEVEILKTSFTSKLDELMKQIEEENKKDSNES